MATSSIFADVRITGKKNVRRFVRALEEAYEKRDTTGGPKVDCKCIHDEEELKKFVEEILCQNTEK